MTWLALRALFGSAFKKLASLNIGQLLCIALALFGAVQTIRVKAEQRHAHKVEQQLSKEIAGRKADRDAYTKAQADAQAANKAQVAAVKQQQQEITDDVEARYRADLARLRAGSVRGAPQGHSSGTGTPNPGAPPSGPHPEAVPLSGPELLRAQQTELQLNALIDWVLKQSAVDPNGVSK